MIEALAALDPRERRDLRRAAQALDVGVAELLALLERSARRWGLPGARPAATIAA